MHYTIKSANVALTKQAKHAFMVTLPAAVFINTRIKTNPLLELETFIHKPTIPLVIHKKKQFWKVPRVTRHNSPKWSAAEFLATFCNQGLLFIYNQTLVKRQPGESFTWATWAPAKAFINVLAQEENMPPGYKEFFLNTLDY